MSTYIHSTRTYIRHILCICILCMCVFLVPHISEAQERWAYDARPQDVLNHVVEKTGDDIISTTLDQVNNDSQRYGEQYKLSNTLDSVRMNIAIYLQRLAFATLTLGTMLIIYNGLRLVLSPIQPEEAANVKKRIVYIIAGLLVGTWFYYLIKIVLSVMIQLTG